jgi:hypothetical protein
MCCPGSSKELRNGVQKTKWISAGCRDTERESEHITPITIILGLCLGLLQLVLPRRYAFVPVFIGGCYMRVGEHLLIAGLHFYLLRVLILFGVTRVLLRGELSSIRPNGIDGVLIAGLVVHTFLFLMFDGTNTTLNGRLGTLYDAVGVYLLVRASVRSVDDALAVLKACAVVVIPLAVPFIMESVSGRNAFAALGGVPPLSEIRDGHVRSTGPFKHPILAGTFAATTMPLFVGLWASGKASRVVVTFAIASVTIIVITSRSSGPLSAFAVASVGLLIWPCRNMMRVIRWGMLLALLGLALVMKQPIWFLIARVSDLTGGGGWYRSGLIDAAVQHFDEWWLIGTGYTAHWMATGVTDTSADLVNQFVAQGVNGGLLTVLLFVWLLVKCFQAVGTGLNTPGHSSRTQFAIWSMGCGLAGHVASFFSVSYYDQIIIFWCLLIGSIVAVASQIAVPVSAPNLTKVHDPLQRARGGSFQPDLAGRDGFARVGKLSVSSRRPQQT